MVSLEHYLLTGLPIPIDGLGLIHQPTINDILSTGTVVEGFIHPFMIRLETIELDKLNLGSFTEHLKDFDLLFLKIGDDDYIFKDNEGSLLNRLITCLTILYNTNDVVLSYEEQTIYINKDIEINRNNFTRLADIILEVFQTSKPVKQDNTPKYKDKYRQQLWEKLEKRRAEEAKKKALTLADIINIVVHANGYTSYKEVCLMTYYQLLNTYKTMMDIISYNEYLMFKSSGQFEMKQDNKHWTVDTKVKKSSIVI